MTNHFKKKQISPESNDYFNKSVEDNKKTLEEPLIHKDNDYNIDQKESNSHVPNLLNVWICLFHTCLNSISSTIVFPTNSKYISSLNSNGFMSGCVIAATHCAAIIFTFIYSNWTNKSYRQPILFSCFIYFIGNLLYSLAGNFMSVGVMTMGRFFIGIGSARVVNRRYLIDHIDKDHILHYSHMYVIMTCAGNLLGPLLSVVLIISLSGVEYSFFGDWIRLNEFTWPVWICNLIWLVFTLFVILFFEERTTILKMKSHESKLSEDGQEIENETENPYEEINNKEQEEDKFEPLPSFMVMKMVDYKSKDEFEDRNEKVEEDQDQERRKIRKNDNNISKVSNLTKIEKKNKNLPFQIPLSFIVLVYALTLVKMLGESLFVAAPILLRLEFGYDTLSAALFLSFIAFTVVPTYFVIDRYLKEIQERKMILVLPIISLICSLLLISYPFFNMTLTRFVLFGTIFYIVANIGESFTSALLANVFPSELSKKMNICNAGFTIIFSTTGGKLIGAILITILSIFFTSISFGNKLFGLYAVLLVVLISLVYYKYSDLIHTKKK